MPWQSKRIREVLALADGVDSGIFLAALFAELTTGKAKPELLLISCTTDTYSLYDAVKSTKFVADKRLLLEISHIKELIQRRQIKQLQWLAARDQLEDCLTKKGASSFGLLKAIGDKILYIYHVYKDCNDQSMSLRNSLMTFTGHITPSQFSCLHKV